MGQEISFTVLKDENPSVCSGKAVFRECFQLSLAGIEEAGGPERKTLQFVVSCAHCGVCS